MKSFLQAERDSWFNALFLAMDTVNPSENAEQGHVIQMMTFAESTDCFHCGKLLQVCHSNLEKKNLCFHGNFAFFGRLYNYDSL